MGQVEGYEGTEATRIEHKGYSAAFVCACARERSRQCMSRCKAGPGGGAESGLFSLGRQAFEQAAHAKGPRAPGVCASFREVFSFELN